jgi:hypothetical protein
LSQILALLFQWAFQRKPQEACYQGLRLSGARKPAPFASRRSNHISISARFL